MPKIAIVAGEASGDLLGVHLIEALNTARQDLTFFGIAGPKMISAGAKTLYPMERLSVRGYIEVLKHFYGLIKLRKNLLKQILEAKPDVFVGIDAPDFNFWLESKLKRKGIPTIHYVSPSIWAWRGGRIHKIKRAVSHMLALFPFEPALYEAVNVPVTYVGHPLADEIPMRPSQKKARELLKLEQGDFIIAMLPGSRQSEVEHHAALLVNTAKLITEQKPDTLFLVPLITRETRKIFEVEIEKCLHKTPLAKPLNIKLLFGHAHDAMEASDAVIVASGTATLEAALLKRPMVITYRISAISGYMMKAMHYLPYVGLPNILANKFLVPELLQKHATPEKITKALLEIIDNPAKLKEMKQAFTEIHQSLRQDSAKKSAEVVLSYLDN